VGACLIKKLQTDPLEVVYSSNSKSQSTRVGSKLSYKYV
jgi:hypothetical protein